MGKILSWLLLVALGYLVYRFLVLSRRKAEREAARRAGAGDGAGDGAGRRDDGAGAGRSGGAGPGAPGEIGERMLPCAKCGVHVPASEAVLAGGRAYCCAAHRDADPRG